MNKKDVIDAVTNILKANNIKKNVGVPKSTFTISDSDGNSKTFAVKKTEKKVYYTREDVSAILDTALQVIQENMRLGEPTSFYGFGNFSVKYRPPRTTRAFGSGEDVLVKGRFVPKFTFGRDLRMCANTYGLSIKDKLPDEANIYNDPDYDEGE